MEKMTAFAQKLMKKIGCMYLLGLGATAGLLICCGRSGQIMSSLVDSEVVYVMLALWLAVPAGLLALLAAVWTRRKVRDGA